MTDSLGRARGVRGHIRAIIAHAVLHLNIHLYTLAVYGCPSSPCMAGMVVGTEWMGSLMVPRCGGSSAQLQAFTLFVSYIFTLK